MQRFPLAICILFILALGPICFPHSVALAARIVVCSGSAASLPGLTEAARAATEDIYTQNIMNSTIIPTFSLHSVLLTDNSLENEALAQAQVAAGASLAIVDSQDGIVAATFGEAKVRLVSFERSKIISFF